MKINRKKFFDNYRNHYGRLSSALVKNIDDILTGIDEEPRMHDKRFIGYTFGTSKIESNETFAPVVEGYWIKKNRVDVLYNYYKKHNPGAMTTIFPNGRHGTAYYGRGRVVQLTHDFNYEHASHEVYGDDRLLNNPDLIITDPACDLAVTFRGMLEGWFTGKKLSDYFNANRTDYYSARKIINGIVPAVCREIARASEIFADGVEFVDDQLAMEGYNREEYLETA